MKFARLFLKYCALIVLQSPPADGLNASIHLSICYIIIELSVAHNAPLLLKQFATVEFLSGVIGLSVLSWLRISALL
jgi:hypothetical protein